MLAALKEFVSRTKALATLRAKDDRILSKANLDRLEEIQDELQGLDQEITILRKAAEAPSSESDEGADKDQGKALFLQYQRIKAGIIPQPIGGK